MTGELSGGELQKLYAKDFAVFEAEAPNRYGEGHELRKLTARSYTPVWVFLDSSGKKVLESTGFRNTREARAIHAFVSGRHYLKTGYQEFLAAFPKG